MRFYFTFLFLLIVAGLSVKAQSQTSPLTIIGTNGNKTTFSTEALLKLPQTSVRSTDKQNKMHVYKGVSLFSLLKTAGVTDGSPKGPDLRRIVWAKARDGYKVVFSMAELNPIFNPNTIIVALTCDGKKLSLDEGPLRLMVQGAKKQARSARQLELVEVLDAK